MLVALLTALLAAGTPTPCRYLFLPALHTCICVPTPPATLFRPMP